MQNFMSEKEVAGQLDVSLATLQRSRLEHRGPRPALGEALRLEWVQVKVDPAQGAKSDT